MSEFTPLSDDQSAALERALLLEKKLHIAVMTSTQALVRARLNEHTAARLNGSDSTAVQTRAMLLRRQADALVESQQATAAARVLRFRLARLLTSWQRP
jgi:hypothetical protein